MHRKILAIITLTGGALAAAPAAEAACGATVNGRPMSVDMCAAVYQVYGAVVPGHYRVDQAGNWVNLANPAHRGNLYRDAQRGSGGGTGGGGLTRNQFGSVGGGYYYDNESGVVVGP